MKMRDSNHRKRLDDHVSKSGNHRVHRTRVVELEKLLNIAKGERAHSITPFSRRVFIHFAQFLALRSMSAPIST